MRAACLSELSPFLRAIDGYPLKRLSQNFLVDANIIRKIVKLADVAADEQVLEIGPGPGALTEELLKTGARVIAIEKDPRFAQELTRFSPERLTVFTGDFLDFPLDTLTGPIKIVANLPYHITSPILEKLTEHRKLFSSAFLMVQKEVAQRMVAQKNTKEMSSFTIFLQTYADAKILMKVSPTCFYPVPSVDSCVVSLHFREIPLLDPDRFLKWVQRAFQQRRKMLRSTLAIQEGPFATLRPEALSLTDWLSLYQTIHSTTL